MNLKWLLAAFLLMGAAGCEKKSVMVAPRPQPVFGTGAIEGRIHFKGPRPMLQQIQNLACCEGAPKTLPDETVVVNDKGGLGNVVVYLTNISASDGSGRAPAVLDQKFCRYVPHVLAVQVGQALKITTSDPTPHNVHYSPTANRAGNIGMTVPGASTTVTFGAGEFIPFRCDVHPWMHATVAVMENPFFAVSESDGSFKIERVPPGQYTLNAWHERYGELNQTIRVKESGATEANFNYEPGTSGQ